MLLFKKNSFPSKKPLTGVLIVNIGKRCKASTKIMICLINKCNLSIYKFHHFRINMVFSVVSKGSLMSSDNDSLSLLVLNMIAVMITVSEIIYTVTYFPCYSMHVHIFTEYRRFV